jgi:uncharacterized YccA/Bax inhibitor family protein
MTIGGAVNKSLLLVGFLLVAAVWSWFVAVNAGTAAAFPWLIGGIIVGLIGAFTMYFKAPWAPVLAPIYALSEGLCLGAVSAMYASRYHGIVLQAAALTVGTLFAMLTAYQLGLIRATEKFKAGVIAATGAIAIFYLVTLVLSLCGVDGAGTLLYGGGPLSIGISLVIVVVAALNLVLDFDFIERGAAQGLPKYMEWYAGFGLLVTLVWLYLEILRLLAKLQKR